MTTTIIIVIIVIIIIIITIVKCTLQKAQDSYLQEKASISYDYNFAIYKGFICVEEDDVS